MSQVECTALHASILRAASTLGHLPLNIIPGCFDIASLAVHAILGIDHKFRFAGLVHYIFIDFGGAKAALWARIFLRVCMCVCECACVCVCGCGCVCVCVYVCMCLCVCARMNASCDTYECVIAHVRMRHVLHQKESYHACACSVYDTRMHCVTPKKAFTSHTWMYNVTHMNASYKRHDHVKHMKASRTRRNASCLMLK